MMNKAELFRVLSDESLEGILVVGETREIVYANKLVGKLFNCDPSEMEGKKLSEVLAEAPMLRNILNNSVHEQFYDAYKVERVFMNFDNHDLTIFRFLPLISTNDAVNELIALNKELKAIYDSSFDGVYVTDGEGDTLRVNQTSAEMCDATVDEMIGKNVRELEKQRMFYPSVTLKVLKVKKPLTIIQNTRSGKQVMVTAIPVFDGSGKISRVVSISKDMTELLRLKQELEDQSMLVGRYREELSRIHDFRGQYGGMVVRSRALKQIMVTSNKLARLDTTLLLLGESGVGKNMLARYIHQASPRREGPFVEVNCGMFPDNLIESELFGYEKGAFTGARSEGKIGFMEIADGGTLFLDEISEIPLKLQVKLLHFLQEKKFTRVGSTQVISVDCRIIAASNNDLEQMVEKGEFREDLYYRLNVFPLVIPPLRERLDDIPVLAEHFLEIFNKKYGFNKKFSRGALDELMSYEWPGNIRELKNLVERLVITVDVDIITDDHVSGHLFPDRRYAGITVTEKGLKESLAEMEKRILQTALKKETNTYRLAEILGISQPSVVKKIKKYGLRKN